MQSTDNILFAEVLTPLHFPDHTSFTKLLSYKRGAIAARNPANPANPANPIILA